MPESPMRACSAREEPSGAREEVIGFSFSNHLEASILIIPEHGVFKLPTLGLVSDG
jgi:hypothetical protein